MMEKFLNKDFDIYDVLYECLICCEREKVEDLLNQHVIKVSLAEDYTFTKGLLGVGWIISYLSYRNIIHVDVEEVLYDFDDNIYKIAINAIARNNVEIREILELITYYQQRYLNQSGSGNFYRRLILKECFKLLINKLSSIMNRTNFDHSVEFDVEIVFKMSFLIMNSDNEKELQKVFYATMENLMNYYSLKKDFQENDVKSLYYLLLSAKQYKHPYWIFCLENILSLNFVNTPLLKSLKKLSDNFLNNNHQLSNLDLKEIENKNFVIYTLISNLKNFDLLYFR